MANHKTKLLSESDRACAKRPLRIMHEAIHDFRNFDRAVSAMRAKVIADESVPGWCFLPMAQWGELLVSAGALDRRLSGMEFALHHVEKLQRLSAVGPWRYTQSVYCFDENLFAALWETKIGNELPVDVLTRLPEWSIYVALPKHTGMRGFFAHLEVDDKTGMELRFLLDVGQQLLPLILHIGPWTVAEAVAKVHATAAKGSSFFGQILSNLTGDVTDPIVEISQRLLSLVLYLCSEKPEIANDREPDSSPKNPASKTTKFGLHLAPPTSPRIWQVGQGVGRQLHGSNTGRSHGRLDGERAPMRAHVRSGHWSLYWTGPRSGPQKAVYHWLPPTLVSGHHKEAA